MAGLPSVPVADDLVKSQLIATEHAAVETINTVSRTLVGGSKGAAGLASGLPVLAEALEALDATIEPGMRFTALYPARIDPHLPPNTIPSLLQSGKLPHEREEEAECVREAAAAGELPKEGQVTKFNGTVSKLVAHFDAALAGLQGGDGAA
ncbi:hypothetical protein FNF29_00739 [Cafeteria roenbergensis]|uniref:Uncharacterized protein n=1 Tax=Cafeteria roenbergensis TaxID=33653 RepID=A0A5A8CVS8_CAFRO|nr:hypothetical protein FNF31_05908 [Cafeteria roenbergensis]KAA0156628.1 hypothetical protein FNF29_00739 [Cafeteria roenbergensis]KAA0163897.1 hypothetical protein FNF28_04091 [Cafeteria roenbergensis]|eukprot:KAA0156628.1 hypothetical protein FNF29_00739 [Cafeteria roenbergensis]